MVQGRIATDGGVGCDVARGPPHEFYHSDAVGLVALGLHLREKVKTNQSGVNQTESTNQRGEEGGGHVR